MPLEVPLAPTPDDPAERARWDWSRLAWRIMYGIWDADLRERVRLNLGSVREEAIGTIDLSGNLYKAVWSSLAVLYDTWPTVTHADPDAAAPLLDEESGALRASGLWARMPRIQRDTLGLREMLVRVNVHQGRLVYRPVFPHLVIAEADPEEPDRIVAVKEARLRSHPVRNRPVWTWDVLDIRDPAAPTYRIVDASPASQGGGDDLTSFYLDPGPYPYVYSDGTPFLPYVRYSASLTGRLWDGRESRELVEGTLEVGVKYTFLSHVERNAAWAQRYAVDVRVPGATFMDEDNDGRGRNQLVVDPATVVMFDSNPDGTGQPQIGQWATTANPVEMIEAIAVYERRLLAYAGINPADVIRIGGDPRSGYALAISRDAQRTAQARFEESFRRSDQELVGVSAALMNRATGSTLPESGYRIAYAGIPLSAQEKKAQRDDLMDLIGAGLLDVRSAYQELNPGLSDEVAGKELALIQQINQEAGGAGELPNGAQVTAAQGIVIAVAAGQMPRNTGVSMLQRFFGLAADQADELMDTAGTPSFTPTPDM